MGLTRRAALAGIAGLGAATATARPAMAGPVRPGAAAGGRSSHETRPDLRSALDAVVAADAVWAIAEVTTATSVWRGAASPTRSVCGTPSCPAPCRW